MSDVRVGVDVGGTSAKAVALAPDGTLVASLRVPTGPTGPEGLRETVLRCVARLADKVGTDVAGFASLGVGVPGLVDPAGRVSHAGNLDISDRPVDLERLLTEATGLCCVVANDANVAALGALSVVAAPGTTSLACLNVGTGVAAGVVIDGRIWSGYGGAAGEIGHLMVQPDGEACACGRRGCLETVLSGAALVRKAPTSGRAPRAVDLFRVARDGDAHAAAVVTEWVRYLAWAVELLMLSIDVEIVVVSGGVTEAGAPLLSALRRQLRRGSAVFLGQRGPLEERVLLAPPERMVGAVGAALAGSQAAEQQHVDLRASPPRRLVR